MKRGNRRSKYTPWLMSAKLAYSCFDEAGGRGGAVSKSLKIIISCRGVAVGASLPCAPGDTRITGYPGLTLNKGMWRAAMRLVHAARSWGAPSFVTHTNAFYYAVDSGYTCAALYAVGLLVRSLTVWHLAAYCSTAPWLACKQGTLCYPIISNTRQCRFN